LIFFLTTLNKNFSQKLSNYHISLWRKVFFSVVTNFFFIHIKVAHCCVGSPKKMWTQSLIAYHLSLYSYIFRVLALESISGVKSWFFWQKPPWITFSVKNCQKLSNYHISLWRKVFFFILNEFFFIHIKVAYCCEGSPKTIRTRSLIGNIVFGGFPKKIRNKTILFSH
jgi:hypothetical protein